MGGFRFASLNVRGFHSRKKQNQLHRLLEEKEIDFLAVQETKLENEEEVDRALPLFLRKYEVCVSHAAGLSGGCFLFIKKSVQLSELALTVDLQGRFVMCDFRVQECKWRVICVYAPNDVNSRVQFFNHLRSYLVCDRLVVLLGDFNCVCDLNDRTPTRPHLDRSEQLLLEVVEEGGLLDVANFQTGTKLIQFTHFQRASHARLDRLYCSIELIQLLNAYTVEPVLFTDHCMVAITIGQKRRKHKRINWKLWKLNSQLLKDEFFVSETRKLLRQAGQNGENIFARWETFKQDAKQLAIERASTLNYYKHEKEKQLQRDLHLLYELECKNPGYGTKDIEYIKAQLDSLYQERYAGAVVRSRAEKFLLGEQPTKKALEDEKRHALSKEILEIEHRNRIVTDKEEIERVFLDHYRALLSCPAFADDTKGLAKLITLLPRLSEDCAETLEEPISVQEIVNAVDALPQGKTPGPDGIIAEFYKVHKNEICLVLHEVFQEAYKANALPPSFLRAHTVFIPKEMDNNQRRCVKGYRPITLCNVDYKIFAKVLANRMQSIICEVVGEHQTCGIRGRAIQSNIHVARSVLDCVSGRGDQVAMLQIDLEKAFDRVQHDVLFKILAHVGVGKIILQGVKMSYTNCYTSLVLNNNVTESIPVHSSVRQGCPLSPLLFSLYLEPLCQSIIQSSNVRGYILHSVETKVLAYADDVAFFCTDKTSVSHALRLTHTFCKATGASVNLQKCRGFWHGTWASTPEVFEDIHWSCTPCNYLGVPLESHRNSTTYWSTVAADIDKRSKRWIHRDLSIFTRATICNVFLIAKLWYVLQVLHCARSNIQKFHRVFAVFIWTSTWEPMRRENLFRSVADGGVGLPHLFVRQLVSRFLFLRDQEVPFIREVIQNQLASFIPTFVVSTVEYHPPRLVGYLKEVVDAFNFLAVRFSREYLATVSRKKLTRDLVDILFPTPIYRVLYKNHPGHDVLCRVKKMGIPPRIKTFFFKLHCSILPTKVWLQEKGIFVPWTVNCLLCKEPETVEHIFINCWDAIFFFGMCCSELCAKA